MAAHGTYVYCLIAADRRPKVPALPTRLPGMGRLRLIDLDRSRWLAVADAPLDRYGQQALDAKLSDLDWVSRAAIAHEAVVESFLDEHAILPMKLFTIFATDARAVEQVSQDKRRLSAMIRRVANHVEWGVRVTHLRTPPAPSAKRRGGVEAPLSGASYLSRKKAQRDATAELAIRAKETVAALYDHLAAGARLARRRAAAELSEAGGALLLDAAFLVPRSRGTSFRGLVARQARRLEPLGYHVALTGPWPPYTFVKD
jgi:hypothetical protein